MLRDFLKLKIRRDSLEHRDPTIEMQTVQGGLPDLPDLPDIPDIPDITLERNIDEFDRTVVEFINPTFGVKK